MNNLDVPQSLDVSSIGVDRNFTFQVLPKQYVHVPLKHQSNFCKYTLECHINGGGGGVYVLLIFEKNWPPPEL